MNTANHQTATNGSESCNAMGGGQMTSAYRLRLRIKPNSGGLLRLHANVIVRAVNDRMARFIAVREAREKGLSVIRVESCDCARVLAA